MMILDSMITPIGPLSILCSDNGVISIHTSISSSLAYEHGENALSKDVKKQLDYYFKSALKEFHIPLVFNATPFEESVWHALLKIPYGKTVSYFEIAQSIHHPLAFRAVGNANRKNPFLIVVPCHRVITKNGQLGGYSGGVASKKLLLDLENKRSAYCF
ncbi:MAG: Methylated-DNA--protein-cysteine methyltransferase [Holosporales bacterium]